MLFLHTCDWVLGVSPHTGQPKTQTRRVCGVAPDGSRAPCRYQVGRTYAVQRRFMGVAEGRIRILDVTEETPAAISDGDVAAEGFASREQFLKTYEVINDPEKLRRPCWRIRFEFVNGDQR